jgi:hypothetical protein
MRRRLAARRMALVQGVQTQGKAIARRLDKRPEVMNYICSQQRKNHVATSSFGVSRHPGSYCKCGPRRNH